MIALVMSTFIGMSSNSWLLIWVFLEINTLSICFLLSNESENSIASPGVKYFVIQTLASSLILLSTTDQSGLCSVVIVLSLLTNIGVWPAHLWYINVFHHISININSFFTIITWQNILPLYLLLHSGAISYFGTLVFLTSIIMSAVSPFTIDQNNLSPNSILVLSSLYNNSWIIIAISCSFIVFLIFLAFYSSALISFLSLVSKINNNASLTNLNPWESLMNSLTIAGLPPFYIFWVNISVLINAIQNNIPYLIVILLILIAVNISYIYLNINLVAYSSANNNNQLISNQNSPFFNNLLLSTIALGTLL